MPDEKQIEKPLDWVGRSKKDFLTFPDEVKDEMGFALYLAQVGDKPDNAKPMNGFSGASVMEIVQDENGEAYRAVYAVQLETAIYVLHAFHKKSKTGSKTPKEDMELIKARLKIAIADNAKRLTERSMEGAVVERKRTPNRARNR